MKRFLFSAILLLPILLAHLACGKLPSSPATFPPTATATPVSTPTPVLTPTCGFTSIPYPGMPRTLSLSPGANSVIQNAAQWAAANPGVTAPSVDFSKQMVLEISQTISVSCLCSLVPATIISVCTYSDHIEVDYANSGTNCPPSTVMCESVLIAPVNVLAVVPQSGLPVIWVAR